MACFPFKKRENHVFADSFQQRSQLDRQLVSLSKVTLMHSVNTNLEIQLTISQSSQRWLPSPNKTNFCTLYLNQPAKRIPPLFFHSRTASTSPFGDIIIMVAIASHRISHRNAADSFQFPNNRIHRPPPYRVILQRPSPCARSPPQVHNPQPPCWWTEFTVETYEWECWLTHWSFPPIFWDEISRRRRRHSDVVQHTSHQQTALERPRLWVPTAGG